MPTPPARTPPAGRPPGRPAGLRAVAREAIRNEVATRAVDLFDQKGYDETTIEDICAEADISARSFFRYFASKEEVVIGDVVSLAEALTVAVSDRPSEEDAWTAMRHGIHTLLELEIADQPERFFKVMTVICRSPALRAGYSQKHLTWAQAVTPALVDRSSTARPQTTFAARTLVHVALACLDSALVEWVEHANEQTIYELVDSALRLVDPHKPTS